MEEEARMIRPHTIARRPQRFSLVILGLALGTVLLTGCANSMASTAKGDPAGIATGNKADVVGQVDGAPQYVDATQWSCPITSDCAGVPS